MSTLTEFTPGTGIPGFQTPGDPGPFIAPPIPPSGPIPTIFFVPGICSPVVSPIDDGLNIVSNVVQVDWQLDQTISSFQSTIWNIKQEGLSATTQVSWNTLHRLETDPFSAITLFVPGICSPVIHPIDEGFSFASNVDMSNGIVKPIIFPINIKTYIPTMAWQVDARISRSAPTSWKLIGRKSSNKRITWNTLDRFVNAQKAIAFRVKQRIYIPGVTNEEFNSGLVQPTVHPISFGPHLPTPTIAWNLNQRIPLKRSIRWNTLTKAAKVQQRTTWNTKCVRVSPANAISWNTLGLVTDKGRITWNLTKRLPNSKRTSWNTLTRNTILKSVHFRDLGKVTDQGRITWNVIQNIDPQLKVRWNLADRKKVFSSTTWNTRYLVQDRAWKLISNSPGGICTSIIHPIDAGTPAIIRRPNYGLCQPVVYPIDYGNTVYPGYGFSPIPQIAWRLGINPNGRVAATEASSWNTLEKVNILVPPEPNGVDQPIVHPISWLATRGRIAWNLVKRNNSSMQSTYNVLVSVVVRTPSSKWNVGAPIAQHIRQTSVDRLDFAY